MALSSEVADTVTDQKSTWDAIKRALLVTAGIDTDNVYVATSQDDKLCGINITNSGSSGSSFNSIQSSSTDNRGDRKPSLAQSLPSFSRLYLRQQRNSSSEGQDANGIDGSRRSNDNTGRYWSTTSVENDSESEREDTNDYSPHRRLQDVVKVIFFSIVGNVEGSLADARQATDATANAIITNVNTSMANGEFGKYVVYYAKVYEADQLLIGPGLNSISDLRIATYATAEPRLMDAPTSYPTSSAPTSHPSLCPVSSRPTRPGETNVPSQQPVKARKTGKPSSYPSSQPTSRPTGQPTSQPSMPTSMPSNSTLPVEKPELFTKTETVYVAVGGGFFVGVLCIIVWVWFDKKKKERAKVYMEMEEDEIYDDLTEILNQRRTPVMHPALVLKKQQEEEKMNTGEGMGKSAAITNVTRLSQNYSARKALTL